MHPSPELTRIIRETLPEACIRRFILPCCDIGLYLINEDFPKGPLPQETANAIMEQPYYWAFCWAAGFVLAQQIIQNPLQVSDKTVVDFGSGSGVVAIAAARAGAERVIACDIDPLARQAIKANAELNQVSIEIVAQYRPEKTADVLLAADILYDRANWPLLEKFCQWADIIWLADSRVKNFKHENYRLHHVEKACTLPDLGELEEYAFIKIYTNKN